MNIDLHRRLQARGASIIGLEKRASFFSRLFRRGPKQPPMRMSKEVTKGLSPEELIAEGKRRLNDPTSNFRQLRDDAIRRRELFNQYNTRVDRAARQAAGVERGKIR